MKSTENHQVSDRYTHQDADGLLWRFEEGRPISQLADEVVRDVFELPDTPTTQRVMNSERVAWQRQYKKYYPCLRPGAFSIRAKTGFPLFGFYKVRYSDGQYRVDTCSLGQMEACFHYDDPPIVLMEGFGVALPDVIASQYKKAIRRSIADRLSVVTQAIQKARKERWASVENCAVTFSSDFHGILPDRVKEQIPHFVSVYEDVAIVAEVKKWNSAVVRLHTDPLLVGIDINGDIYMLSHFDCTPMEEYMRREFKGD